MKVYKSLWPLFSVVILIFWMAGCYQPPEFPVIPKIDFQSVDFKEGEIFDTLIVRVRFQDGDGDLGLSGEENDPPYNAFAFKYKSNGDPCRFSDRFNTQECPGLPPEYNCIDYEEFFTFGQDTINDTLYVELNQNQNNFFVDILTKENGQFEVFNIRELLCVNPLYGRFPRLKDNFSVEGPLEGVVEFKPPSSAYFALFRNDTLKLRIRIKDRALHDSNVVESCEFTLNELLELPDGECPVRP